MKYLKIVSGLLALLFTFHLASAQLASERPVATLYSTAVKQKLDVAGKHPEIVRIAGQRKLPSVAAIPVQAMASKRKNQHSISVQAPIATQMQRLPGNSKEGVQEITTRKLKARAALHQ